MSSTSGFDRFVDSIGGPQNLPPKSSETEAEPPALQQMEEEMQAQEEEGDIWSLEKVHALNKKYAEEAAPPPRDLIERDLKFDSRLGKRAIRGIRFSPFLAVTKLCYKFVRREYQQPLATAFFDAGKIYNRPWDLYYVWTSLYPTAKPTIFVPESQLRVLIDEINQAFPKAEVELTDELAEEGLAISFDEFIDELRPQWLGHSTSREQYQHWEAHLPAPEPTRGKTSGSRSLEAFRAKIDDAINISKTKAKAKARKKASRRAAIQKRQEYGNQVLHAQRYLGLLAKNEGNTLLPETSGLSISSLDPSKTAPYPFQLDAIFIAVDVEAYERSPKLVTEVGVATLDTRDLRNVAPGDLGKNWQELVRARHFRVIEYKHLVNRDFVEGCPDRFEFGNSEFVGKDDLPSVLTSCFHQPFGKTTNGVPDHTAGEEERQVILLGHDYSQDIAMLQSDGFNVFDRGDLLEAMDTAVMFRYYTHDVNPTSLGKILYHFDLSGWNLHNAGNDAVYTIWAMLAICVKDAMDRGNDEAEKQLAENAVRRNEEGVPETDGWLADDNGRDSGYAIAPKEEDFVSNKRKARQAYGPARPPHSDTGLWTLGGAALDV